MRRLRKHCGGFTLVEIIVTFALTALFMASASLVLSSFMRSHVTAMAVAGEQNVASILVNTVTDELGAARYRDQSCFGETLPDGTPSNLSKDKVGDAEPPVKLGQLLLGEESGADGKKHSVVWYVSGDSDNKVKLGLDDNGYLVWNYYVLKDGEAGGTEYEKVEWRLGENVYDGCTIEEFKVEQLGEKRSDKPEDPAGALTNCLKVTIRLKSHRVDNNTFTINRSVECRNLKPENIAVMGEVSAP